MQNIILHVTKSPVKGFSHQAALLSILLGHKECWEWVCNNHIQVFSLKNLEGARSGTLDFYYMDYNDFRSYEYAANPWIRYFETPLAILDMENLKSLFIERLENNFYIQIEIDEYFIHTYDLFETEHISHWLYIYGYDKEKQGFYCMDNFRNSKFGYEVIPAEEVINSIKENYNSFLRKLSFNRNMTAEEKIGPSIAMFQVLPYLADPLNKEVLAINMKRIISLLKHYLNIDFSNVPYRASEYYVYGTDVYDSLYQYLESILEGNRKIDVRAFCSFLDHKALMLWRMDYICNVNKDIPGISVLGGCIKNDYRNLIHDKLYLCIMRMLKYNITRKKGILYRILTELHHIKEDEIQILNKFIHLLERLVDAGEAS